MTNEGRARIEVENFLRILLLASFLTSGWFLMYQMRPNHRHRANIEMIQLPREGKVKLRESEPKAPQDNIIVQDTP